MQNADAQAAQSATEKQRECNSAVAEVKAQLALQRALADGSQREVRVLQDRLDELQARNQSILDATMGLKERNAEAAGKEMVLKAEHLLRVGQLEQQLHVKSDELDKLRATNAVMESEVRVQS